MTQDQADWLLVGLEKGYTDGGFGGRMMGGMGPGPRGGGPGAPAAPPSEIQK